MVKSCDRKKQADRQTERDINSWQTDRIRHKQLFVELLCLGWEKMFLGWCVRKSAFELEIYIYTLLKPVRFQLSPESLSVAPSDCIEWAGLAGCNLWTFQLCYPPVNMLEHSSTSLALALSDLADSVLSCFFKTSEMHQYLMNIKQGTTMGHNLVM